MKVKIDVPAKSWGKSVAWIGASIASSLITFQNLWITLEEYEDYGPEIVYRKCV